MRANKKRKKPVARKTVGSTKSAFNSSGPGSNSNKTPTSPTTTHRLASTLAAAAVEAPSLPLPPATQEQQATRSSIYAILN